MVIIKSISNVFGENIFILLIGWQRIKVTTPDIIFKKEV